MGGSTVTPRAFRNPLLGIATVFVAITCWWLVSVYGVGAFTGEEYTRGGHTVRALGATLFVVPSVAVALRYPV